MKKSILTIAMATLFSIGLAGCDDDDNSVSPPTPQPPTITGNLLLLTDNGELASINAAQPGTLVSRQAINGLRSGDSLIGIDYRASDAKLYGLGHMGNIYTIDPATATATFKVALSADPTDTTAPFSGITGNPAQMGLDFNPAADRLRVVGNDGQNLRINVDTGATFTDGSINGADATVTSVAYSNSFAGAATTRMFDIDVKRDRLFLQNPPNDGVLSTSAALGVNATASSGFDINGLNNKGVAVLNVGGSQQLYDINLASIGSDGNAATLLGNLPALGSIRGITLKPAANAATTAVGLTANNQLALFKPTSPGTVTLLPISGLAGEESIVGIDYRLRTEDSSKSGVLYALSNAGNLYTLNPVTGALSNKVALVAAADDTTLPFTALNGSSFAVDFNPFADRLRVISSTGQNLRINVDTGQTTTDGILNGIPAAQVSAGAYTNSFAGMVSATQLFNLERTSNQLVLQAPPNDGTLTVVGALGITLGSATGFDIAGGDNGLALAVVNTGGSSNSTLYKVNLTSGAAVPAINVSAVPNLEASRIGTASTPALLDIALLIQ